MKVIEIRKPLVALPHIIKDASGNFERAIIYVSGKNLCAKESDSVYTLTFSPSAKLTCSSKSMKWDELKNIINSIKEQRGKKPRDTIDFVYGFRKGDSCSVEIRYDGSIICIEDKDISGLP